MTALASKTLSVMRRFSETLAAMRSYWPQSRRPIARIAINMAPRRSPYGGGNQFVLQLTGWLKFYGYEIVFRLDDNVDCILIMDGREALTTFGMPEVMTFKEKHPSVVCIHRVNECDLRKGSGFMDDLLAQVNVAADYTVFVSQWVRDYHAARWFDCNRPHTVVLPGPDSRIFHPFGQRQPPPNSPFRLVTHHWSDNPMKGFSCYAKIDEAIAAGRLKNTELWVIGRWPSNLRWRAARLFPPTIGSKLADLLRQCHGYVTASLWEPGGMHVVEGAACGLPVLYHRDSGGTVEIVRQFGIEFHDNIEDAVSQLQQRYAELRGTVRTHLPSGERMCLEYCRAIQACLLEKQPIG